jgi:hypothetical protein
MICPALMINPFVNVIVDVGPIAVFEGVPADIEISEIKRGFNPDSSERNTRSTRAADAAAVTCDDVNVMKSTREPLAPAVNNVTNVPEPSRAVFAAAILAVAAFGVNVKMGDVFAGILF